MYLKVDNLKKSIKPAVPLRIMMDCSLLILLLRLWITNAVLLQLLSTSRCNGWSEASSGRAALLSKSLCLLLEFVI